MTGNEVLEPQGARLPRRILCALLLLGLAALTVLLPRAAHADGGFTDITGSPIQVHVSYPDKDSGATIELPVPSSLLPQAAQTLLNQPLNQWFDTYWSGQQAQDGTTLRDRSCSGAKDAVSKAISDGTGQTAHDISCAFAPTGSLGAKVVGNELVLSYMLRSNVVTFYVTTPDACAFGVCVGLPQGADPKFTLTFDTEILLGLKFSSSPCAFSSVGGSVLTHNAYIDSGNVTGDLVKDVSNIIQFVGGDGIFPPAQDKINAQISYMNPDFSAYMQPLADGCNAAASMGFTQLSLVTDAGRGTLTVLFTHPLADPPVVSLVGGPGSYPSLFRPVIAANPTEVQAGGQLSVTGNYFTGATATSLQITWWSEWDSDFPLDHSDVEWGPQGGATTVVTLPRHNYDTSSPGYEADNLTPGTSYQFRVRDCDQFTCSHWSAWLDAQAAAAGSNQVQVSLDGGAAIGNATLQPDGTFSTTITVPASTSAGQHTLAAAVGGSGGQQASAGITVVGAGQSLQPLIQMINPSDGTVTTSVEQSYKFTLRGVGFAPGQVTVTLDTPSGKPLGTATAAGDGSFTTTLTMPYVSGNHTLVATETVSGKTIQTSLPVYVEELPR